MARILVIYENKITTVSLLKDSLLEIIQEAEISFCRSMEVTTRMVDDSDVLLIVRPMDLCSLFIAKMAKEAGVFLLLSFDDNLLCMPDTYPHIPWRFYSLERTLAISDVVISTSRLIREEYRNKTMGRRSAAIDTVVSVEEIEKIPVPRQEGGVVRLVYAAGGDHEELFYKYVEPVLRALDTRYGSRISLTFVGVHPEIKKERYSFPIEYVKPMPLHEFRAYMRRKGFEVGLAPLHDDKASSCKYYNKYIEYTLVGTVGVYSKVKPYTFAVKDGVNGYLAENTKEGWLSAVTWAIEDTEGRRQCLLNAATQLRENHNAEKIRERLLAEIPELLGRQVYRKKCRSFQLGRILYKVSRLGDSIYLFVFYFRRDGVRLLFRRIKEHIRLTHRGRC